MPPPSADDLDRTALGILRRGALLFTVLAVVECAGRGSRGTTLWAGPFNGFQAAVGLLLLSLVTPASLAEERARGSLEVLLSTPLSTRSLVLGKWLAHYRVVPWLALLPGLVAIAMRSPPGDGRASCWWSRRSWPRVRP